jgi:PAS domain S-box-containing protein
LLGHVPKSFVANIGREETVLNELEQLRRKVAELEGFKTKCDRLEASLGRSEERFAKLFNSSSNLMLIATLEDGRIIDINEAGIRFSGYKLEEVIGRTTTECGIWVNPEQRSIAVQKLKEEGIVRNLEVEVRTKSGEMRTVLY